MSDSRRPIKTRGAKWAGKMASSLAERGIKPNTISITSSVFSLLAGGLFATAGSIDAPGPRCAALIGAAIAVQLRLLCNLFDGMVAVEGGFKTPSGEIFNDFPDRVSDTFILVGAGYGSALLSGSVLGWLAAVLALATAYARVLGAASGASHCFVGPMAQQHRMAIMTVAALGAAGASFGNAHGYVLAVALGAVAAGCLITVIRRLRRVVGELERAG